MHPTANSDSSSGRPPGHQPATAKPDPAARREMVLRAKAALPEHATDHDVASVAIQMRKEEAGCTWTELVSSGWTFSADQVRAILDAENAGGTSSSG